MTESQLITHDDSFRDNKREFLFGRETEVRAMINMQ